MPCLVLQPGTNNEPNFPTRCTGLTKAPADTKEVEAEKQKQLTKQKPERLTRGGMKE